MAIIHFNQRNLATRWVNIQSAPTVHRVQALVASDALSVHVLYRLIDIEAYEVSCLSTPTKPAVAGNVAA